VTTLPATLAPKTPRTYPLVVHRLLRQVVRTMPRFPKVWRLRQHVLDIDTVRFPDGLVDAILVHGPRMWVEPNDLIGRHIFYQGAWERSTTWHFFNELRAGDTVLDIGANIGQYTVLAGARVGPQGQVFAVEPGSAARRLLERNINRLGSLNTHVLPIAAWDSDTTLYLNSGDVGNCGSAEVSPADEPARAAAQPVPARRLGPLLREAGCRRIDVIKIDVEGAELPALRGLEEYFQQAPPRSVYCELLGSPNRFGATAQDLLGFFDWFGYHAWSFGDEGLGPLDRSQIGPETRINVLFTLK
jgi:FkbM family methyltransferase